MERKVERIKTEYKVYGCDYIFGNGYISRQNRGDDGSSLRIALLPITRFYFHAIHILSICTRQFWSSILQHVCIIHVWDGD